jgi:hypothetical protein
MLQGTGKKGSTYHDDGVAVIDDPLAAQPVVKSVVVLLAVDLVVLER